MKTFICANGHLVCAWGGVISVTNALVYWGLVGSINTQVALKVVLVVVASVLSYKTCVQ